MTLNLGTVAVLGSGSWGTALAHHLTKSGQRVVLWGRDRAVLDEVSKHQQNSRYFSTFRLVDGIKTESNLELAVLNASLIVLAVPSSAVRAVAQGMASSCPSSIPVVSAAKGIEEGSWKRLSVVLTEEIGGAERIGVLSGPTFARELLEGYPTAATLAFNELSYSTATASFFHYDNFRVYSSSDVLGVELGGVVKNVIALATGILDGLGMGMNARAALITRGLSEMSKLIVALGGQAETVMGLSGLGDLLLTCTGDLSRNRKVGLLLGQGKSLREATRVVGQVAEGVSAAHKVLALARDNGVSMPIVEEVTRVMSGEINISDAVKGLLSRSQKEE